MSELVNGRPTKFKPEYCDALVDHMASGLSFESFAGVIGVTRSTVYEWVKAQPSFSDAKKLGESLALLWWEKISRSAVLGEIDGFNATVFVFSMKNRFGWRDRVENTGHITVEPYIIQRRDGSQVELGHKEQAKLDPGENDETR